MKRQHGFTMIEMAIVLIMIGILTASLAPLLLRQHNSEQEAEDRTALEEAEAAIINYAITYGGFPDPTVASEVPANTFGVNNWGTFGGSSKPFMMDVNDKLKSSYVTLTATGTTSNTGGDKVVFCQSVNAEMQSIGTSPRIYQDADGTLPASIHTAIPGTAPLTNPAALVLFSRGNNQAPDQANTLANDLACDAVKSCRIYENDKRGINNNQYDNIATSFHYDDQVRSYPLSALARDCREKMGVAQEAMSCWTGRKALIISNLAGGSNVVYYTTTSNAPLPVGSTTINAGANVLTCTAVVPGTSIAPVCQSRNDAGTPTPTPTTVQIYGSAFDCAADSTRACPATSCVPKAITDSNNDGIARIMVTGVSGVVPTVVTE